MRFLLALAFILGIAGAGYGAAASLTVNGGAIQYGSDDMLTCDDGVEIAYATTNAIPPRVSVINIDGIDAACNGQAMRLQLTHSSGEVIYEANPIAVAGTINHSIPTALRPLVTDVADVHITIY